MIIQHYHIRYLTPSSNLIINYKVTIVLLICLQIAVNNFAQKKSADNNGWLMATINQLEKNIETANERITLYENSKGAELIVLDGEVEIKSNDGMKTVMIKANQEGVFDNEDNLFEPQDIDPKRLEDWWVESE